MKTGRGKRTALLVGAVAAVVLGVAGWLAWPHLRFWWLFESLGPNSQRYPEYRHRQTGIIFVRVPGGTFWMGAQKTDPNGPNYDPNAKEWEGPVHEVTLSQFLVGKYEVTQAQWLAIMGSNPSELKGDDLPVEQVSWGDCQAFCETTGLRFPTEAQWEWACLAGKTKRFAFGTTITPKKYNHRVGDGYGKKIVAVTWFAPNGIGLHHTRGNGWEWCEDTYDEKFYASPDASHKDPLCNSDSWSRVVRDGGFSDFAPDCSCSTRSGVDIGIRGRAIGLRAAFWPLP